MSEDEKIQALLLEYSEARDDERYFTVAQGTAFTLGLSALFALGILATEKEKGTHIPDAILATTPLSVLAILAFITGAGTQSVLRSFYLRCLERELRERLQLGVDLGGYKGLLPMSCHEMITTYTSMASSGRYRESSYYRGMTGIIFAILWVSFGGIIFYFGYAVSLPWKLLMLLIYPGGAGVVFWNAVSINIHGRKLFQQHVLQLRMLTS